MPEQFRKRIGRGGREHITVTGFSVKGLEARMRKDLLLTLRNEQPEVSWRRRSWFYLRHCAHN